MVLSRGLVRASADAIAGKILEERMPQCKMMACTMRILRLTVAAP
jgi:hypothetical protein